MNQIVLHNIKKVIVNKTTKERLAETNTPYCVTHIVAIDDKGVEMDITLFSDEVLLKS